MRKFFSKRRAAPSLARRLFLTIITFNILFVLLMTLQMFLVAKNDEQSASIRWVKRGSYRINELTTEQDAQAFGAAWQKAMVCIRICHTEVWTKDGRRIYADRIQPTAPPLIGLNGQVSSIIIDGKKHALFRLDGPRWSFRISTDIRQPNHGLDILDALYQHAIQPLIFLLFLVTPIWFAVRYGLLPLRSLAAHLGQRQPGELTPLNFTTRYRELQPLVQALESLLSQLRGKVQREYAFLQDATHELRTPIAVISAQAHLLAKAATPLARHTATQQIDHAMARAAHLIAQLSELARVDSQTAKETQLLDVVDLVKRDLMVMELAAQARQIAIVFDAPGTLCYRMEANTFLSIVENLVNNAIRYGKPGGKIVVTLRQAHNELLLRVADDGPGISLAQRERVFERFHRGVGHEVSGAGLGLAIVQQAAARLEAKLEISDGLHGQGCAFSVLIPPQ
jgi:two-component system, OmpR family, sensor histidine kinase QseC